MSAISPTRWSTRCASVVFCIKCLVWLIFMQRELFLTGPTETVELDAKALLKPCVVVHKSDVLDLEAWFDISPFNFYARYRLPTLNSPWAQRKTLHRTDVLACDICLEQHNERFQLLSDLSSGGQVCLRTFDPFGGVGAFGLAMEELGCMKLTHAVEITPSAALTLRYVFLWR